MRLKYFVFLLLPFALTKCARQTSPTGGPKDTIPPTLLSRYAIPQNDQTNFKSREIELLFDELVILNNPKEQIIITPGIGKDYEIKVKNNKVLITLEKDLKDSTTYTFNFRDAIQDITEKNPAKNLQLAFSTGSYIDSLSIQGNVYDILEGKPLEDITVAIQPTNDTFNLFKHPSTYFTKSDEKGNYIISHLKPGTYHIYAIDDKNKNLIADSRNEAYGFLKDSIALTTNRQRVDIGLIKLDARPLKITSARPYNTYFNIRFTKGLQNFSASSRDSIPLYYGYGSDQSNIQLYNTLTTQDSLLINIQAADSIENTIDTALYIKFTTRDIDPERFTHAVKKYSLLADKGILTAKINFNKPLKEINFDSLVFEIDSLNNITFNQQDLDYNELKRELTIRKKIDRLLYKKAPPATPQQQPTKGSESKPGKTAAKTNSLTLGKGTFISIEQDSSASTKQTITPQYTEDLGVIIVHVKTNSSNFIVQLLDKEGQVIQESQNKIKTTFEDVQPAEYQLRIIDDKNGNGQWDPGNYLQEKEPEPIKYYSSEKGVRAINLKANWELGPLLITY